MSTKYENSVYEEAGSGSESQPPYAVIQQKRPKTSRILVFAIFSLIAINMAISITALVQHWFLRYHQLIKNLLYLLIVAAMEML